MEDVVYLSYSSGYLEVRITATPTGTAVVEQREAIVDAEASEPYGKWVKWPEEFKSPLHALLKVAEKEFSW